MKQVHVPWVTEEWELAHPEHGSGGPTIVETFGRPLATTWTPMRMKLVREDEHGHPWKEADMPWLGSHLLILRPRAVMALAVAARQKTAAGDKFDQGRYLIDRFGEEGIAAAVCNAQVPLQPVQRRERVGA